MNSGQCGQRAEGHKGHSPFGSFQGALQVDVEVADREGVDVSVLEGVQDSVRRCVEEGVRIPGLGVSREVPPLDQEAQGEEQDEGDRSHATHLLHLGFGLFGFVLYIEVDLLRTDLLYLGFVKWYFFSETY